MIPCLVLTAGLGTRLRPLTDLLAKPALPVAGEPLVARILRWLVSEGVTDAVLNLSHLPQTVAGAVGDGGAFGVNVRYSWEQPVLGSAGGPRHALPLLGPRFLIVNGDTLTNVRLADLIATHERTRAEVTMAVVPHPAPDRYGGVRISEAGWIESFSARSPAADGALWHFVGAQVVEASVFANLPDNEPAESVGDVYRPLVAARRVAAHRCDATFRDIGRPEDYLETTFAVAAAEGHLDQAVVEPGATVEPGARLERVILWPGSRVASDVALSHCIVAGAEVPAGTRAERACLTPGPDGVVTTGF